MQRSLPIFLLFTSLLLAGCSSSTYKTTADGITLQVKKSESDEKHHIPAAMEGDAAGTLIVYDGTAVKVVTRKDI